MEKETGIVFGVAFIFSAINGLFSLVDSLVAIFAADSLLKGLGVFITRSSLWLVITAVIIAVLYYIIKKQNQSVLELYKDKTIRTSAGVLVMISGLFSFSSILPVIFSTISTLKILGHAGMSSSDILANSILVNSVHYVIVLCQILCGIFLMLKKENKAIIDSPS